MNEVGQVKKVWGDTLQGEGGDTRVRSSKTNKSDSNEQKRSSVFLRRK